MRVDKSGLKILSAFAAILLVAACETSSDQSSGSSSYGSGSTTSSIGGSAQPGTQQDLAVNVGDRVLFGYNQFNLSKEARNVLERQATWLKGNPGVNVVIEGHCDERGTREFNLALGERRASAVRSYMVALGIADGRITTISYGKERPIAFGSISTDWAKNRRGVTVVQ